MMNFAFKHDVRVMEYGKGVVLTVRLRIQSDDFTLKVMV